VAKVKRLISFKFSTTDYENHEVYFYISWGDGEFLAWEGPFSSGEEIEFGHAYQETGDYTIVARAMDQYEARSIQSNFNLKISTDRGKSNIFNLRFVEFLRHNLPNMYLLLRYIITIQ
jgi:hypothetical protein